MLGRLLKETGCVEAGAASVAGAQVVDVEQEHQAEDLRPMKDVTKDLV